MADDRMAEYAERRALEQKRSRARRNVPAFSKEARRAKIEGRPCRVCWQPQQSDALDAWVVEYHHIVPRAKFAKGDPDVAHLANAMPVCHRHHQDHHTNPDRRIPGEALTTEERLFAIGIMGEAWVDRWYPKGSACA